MNRLVWESKNAVFNLQGTKSYADSSSNNAQNWSKSRICK